jgi:hypothetical protein
MEEERRVGPDAAGQRRRPLLRLRTSRCLRRGSPTPVGRPYHRHGPYPLAVGLPAHRRPKSTPRQNLTPRQWRLRRCSALGYADH